MNAGPGAPAGFDSQAVTSPSQSATRLNGVPASSWTYGCSATAAGMIFGYYDRNGYSNMYTGSANGGVAPLTNLGNTSLIASKKGVDGRTTNGHVDDYWISYGSSGPDPWETNNREEHAWDSVADFLGTSQWKWDFLGSDGEKDFNFDGATALWAYNSASKLYDYVPNESKGLPQTSLSHGMRLFAESRGYSVLENYTQKIDVLYEGGFSFDDYIAEIEHERVMKGQRADATLDDQNRALRFFEKFIGELVLLSKIKPRHAEAFISHRLSTVPSVSTVNKDIRTLRRIFNLAIEPRGYLPEGKNPFAKMKERKTTDNEIRYVEIKEYLDLMGKARNLWWRGLLSLAYGSGLRRNEILHLTWKDIDFENHLIKITAKKSSKTIIEWDPKGRRNRIVPMSDENCQLLADLQAQAKEHHPYIFISPQRLKRIQERQRKGDWNTRSQVINNLDKNFRLLRSKAACGSG